MLLAPTAALAVQRIYLAPDDHTDWIWSATEAQYEQYFQDMLDFYKNAANTDIAAGQPFAQRSKFTTDGSYWLWVYEKRRSAAQFNAVMDRVKDGHITVPMSPNSAANTLSVASTDPTSLPTRSNNLSNGSPTRPAYATVTAARWASRSSNFGKPCSAARPPT